MSGEMRGYIKRMKYAILQIKDHAATLSVWEDSAKLKEDLPVILDETWFLEGNTQWKEYLAYIVSQDVEVMFIKTNRPSAYIASRYELSGRVYFLQQLLQEQTNIPIIDGLPEQKIFGHEYLQSKIGQYTWFIRYYGYHANQLEKAKETMLTVGNGYLALRGTLVETKRSPVNYPGFYIARGFNRLTTQVGSQIISNEDLVNLLNFQFFTVQIFGEEPIVPNEHNVKEIIREIDLRNGVYTARMILDCGDKRFIELTSKKIANRDNYHQLALSYTIRPLNFNGKILIVSQVDTNVINEGVNRYSNLAREHVEIKLAKIQEDFINVLLETTKSKINVQATVRVQPIRDPEMITVNEPTLQHNFLYRLQDGEAATVEKIVDIQSSLDGDTLSEQPKIKAVEHMTFAKMAAISEKAWQVLWKQADIAIAGDVKTQHLLRVNMYHLFICASPQLSEKIDASIGARGLHGEAEHGHVFWDELFIAPFYLRCFPTVVRQMLLYRYRRLDKAKSAAKALGLKGALYPWESGVSGTEEAQTLRFDPVSQKWGANYNVLQWHVSLAIAYNTIMYINMTGDRTFLQEYGGEMLWEIALFWSSVAVRTSEVARYSICNVMGPDSFHEKYPDERKGGVVNNAYTNLMVVWFFRELPKIYALLDKEASQKLFAKINYNMADYQKMQVIGHMLELDIDDGIIAQHKGYLKLAELDLEKYRAKYGNIQRMDRILRAERKNPEEYQIAEQADTLLSFYNLPGQVVEHLLHTLGYELGDYYFERNLLYYIRRTTHGSPLSHITHTYLASKAGMQNLAWEFYQRTLAVDYHDLQEESTAEGIHASVLAGSISLTLSTYAGFDYRGQILKLNPNLPKHWQSIRFNWQIREATLTCEITQEVIKIICSDDIIIEILGKEKLLRAREIYRFQYAGSATKQKSA